MRMLDLDPRELNPVSLELTGKLDEVLVGSGAITATDQTRGWRRYQVLRYFCGTPELARLVRLQLVVSGEIRNTITPSSDEDEMYLDGLVPEGATLELRVIRAPGVDPAALPPIPDSDIRFEVQG